LTLTTDSPFHTLFISSRYDFQTTNPFTDSLHPHTFRAITNSFPFLNNCPITHIITLLLHNISHHSHYSAISDYLLNLINIIQNFFASIPETKFSSQHPLLSPKMSSPAQKRKVPPGGNNDDGVSLTTTQNIANTNKPHHTHPKQTNPHHSSDLKQHHQKDGSKNGKKHPKLACFYYSKSTLSNEQKQLHFDHYQTISSILGTNTLPKNKSIRPLDALNPFFPDVFIAPIKNQTSSNRFLELNFFPN